jgi:hypothetical protein
VVSLLKQVFQNQLRDLVSIRSTDTLVLLTLFEDTESNYDDHSCEITSSYGFFATVLLQLTFEIVFYFLHKGYSQTPTDNIPILIIGHLPGPLAFLDAFLIRSLQEACTRLRNELRLPALSQGFETYDYWSLRKAGILQLVGAQKSGGMTCTAAIVFVPKRNMHDAEWRGDMLKLHLLYLALTRATDRVYIFAGRLAGATSNKGHGRPCHGSIGLSCRHTSFRNRMPEE